MKQKHSELVQNILFLKKFWRGQKMFAYFLSKTGLILLIKKHQNFTNILTFRIPMLLKIIKHQQPFQWIVKTTSNNNTLPNQTFQLLQIINSLLIQTFQINKLPIKLFDFYQNFLRNYTENTWQNLIKLLWLINKINGLEFKNSEISYCFLATFFFNAKKIEITKLNKLLNHTLNFETPPPKTIETIREYCQLFGFLLGHLETYGGLQVKRLFWLWFQQVIGKLTD